MPSSRLTDLRPERKPTALHKAVTGGEEEGNAGHTDDLTGVVDLSLKLNITYLGGRYFLALVLKYTFLNSFCLKKSSN